MRRSFIVASMFFALSHISMAGTAPIKGLWEGEMRQIDPEQESKYPMWLWLEGTEGSTDYPALDCRGKLKKIAEVAGGYTIYKETITRGRLAAGKERGCIDGVLIVSAENGTLVLGWFANFENSPSLASAVLTRVEGK